jgi:glycosyltransferase involved in cell wall biosynthesis
MEYQNLPPLKISVIVPNHNGSGTLKQCLEAIRSSSYKEYEYIVVDDASTDNSVAMAKSLSARVVVMEGKPLGPASARNHGAQAAAGDILFFVDADVVIYPDTLQKIAGTFAASPELAAVFGSYDDNPGDVRFLSQYKNLFHHFVHQHADENSTSFWSGCGAIRRAAFIDIGGFDTLKYPHPSIEDIELGRRLISRGYKIRINKTIQVKHLKRWTLSGLVKTDVFDRGIPWTQLVLADRKIPNDLNLESSQRWSALFIGILLLFMAASAIIHHQMVLLPILFCLLWLTLQSWQWQEQLGQFYVGRRSFLGISILFALFASLAFWFGAVKFLIPILLLFGIVVAGQWFARRGRFWRSATFAFMMIIIGISMLQIVLTYPVWLITLAFLTLGIFILLNRQFYAFFSEKRGIMFAITVIPFHLLYFLYSMFAFALGALIYFGKASLPFINKQAEHKT